MEYSNTNILNTKQQNEIQSLLNLCKKTSPYKILSFAENDYNFFSDLPCFFMAHEQNTLIGFLSLFVPNNEECELYAFVHPDFRKQGIFSHLFDMAAEIAHKFNITNILTPLAPVNIESASILKNRKFELSHSEYVLRYEHSDMIERPSHTDIDNLNIQKKDHVYTLYYKQTLAGTCSINYSVNAFMIYSFEILPNYRNKGYGSYMLDYMIHDLLHQDPNRSILLQVNSGNTVAFNMYLRHHFITDSQLDYYFKDPISLNGQ